MNLVSNSDIFDAMKRAGVPPTQHVDHMTHLDDIKRRTKGLAWMKLKARLFKAKKLAKQAVPGQPLLPQPLDEDYGFVPYYGVNLWGDNNPWVAVYRMPDGSEREVLARWRAELSPELKAWALDLEHRDMVAVQDAGGVFITSRPAKEPFDVENDTDPASNDYRAAVARNYWAKGLHPRDPKAIEAWIRRNACEREAWRRGDLVSARQVEAAEVYEAAGINPGEKGWVRVLVARGEIHNLVQVRFTKRVAGVLVECSLGNEIDNIRAVEDGKARCVAFPRPGYKIMAAATWGITPTKKGRPLAIAYALLAAGVALTAIIAVAAKVIAG